MVGKAAVHNLAQRLMKQLAGLWYRNLQRYNFQG
jgi:hypothetical protein